MMRRDECLRLLAARLPADQIVVAAYTAAFDWIALRPSPLNYISSGAMGLTSSHALGFAIGMPDRRIVLLDGDGSLLMNLGALVTIADAAPKNLVHFLCRNGTYEANGSHPIPGRGRVDFAGMARAAGYPRCYRFADLATFETGIGSLLQEEGPVFADLELEPGEKYPRDYGVMHGAQIRRDFAAALKGGAA